MINKFKVQGGDDGMGVCRIKSFFKLICHKLDERREESRVENNYDPLHA